MLLTTTRICLSKKKEINLGLSHKLIIYSFCDFSKAIYQLQTLNLLPVQKLCLPRRNKQTKTSTQRKHLNTGLYCRSGNFASYYLNIILLGYNFFSFNNSYSRVSYPYLIHFFNFKRHMLR